MINGLILPFVGLACVMDSAAATFTPPARAYTGPQLVRVIDTNAAPVHCLALAAQHGDLVSALSGLLAPSVACAAPAGAPCTIIAPLRPGPGQLLAAIGALTGPDALLGHELRHCRDGVQR